MYLLSPFCISETVLGTGDKAMPACHRLSILVGETELIKMSELYIVCRKVIKTGEK